MFYKKHGFLEQFLLKNATFRDFVVILNHSSNRDLTENEFYDVGRRV